jgi:hypothetical protein
MKPFVIFLFSLVALMPAVAKSAYDVTASDQRFLSDVIAAVGRKDAAWIAAHSALPIAVVAGNEHRILKKKEEFAEVVARSLTEDLCARIRAEAKKTIFKNWQGVMVGDGILWFTEYRVSKDSPWQYVITAFGDFAFQPKEEANQPPEPTRPFGPSGSS